jgi:RsiW-degrading membrane proteinase PrsW (M82 family)
MASGNDYGSTGLLEPMNLHCTGCGADFTLDTFMPGSSVACPDCLLAVAVTIDLSAPTPDSEHLMSRMSDRISRAAGVQRLQGFSFRETFSEVFTRHTDEEVERYFAVGGPDTTPPLAQIDVGWPKPWVFFRMFLLAVLAYVGFVQAWEQFNNMNLLPGLIMVGSFAMPFTTLILFFEFNVRRNVSLFQIARLVMVGGVASLVFALLMYQLADMFHMQWLGASVAGIAEEPGKLLVLAFVVNKKKYSYILNGLLFGAAVGAGFAAFESAGYALRIALDEGTNVMRDAIFARGLLSPFAHIVWTAMSAAALWRVKGAAPLTLQMLKDKRFTRVFAAAILLHMVWDSPLRLPLDGTYLILGAIAWVIVLGLVQEGLEEVRTKQAAAGRDEPPQSRSCSTG